MEAALEVALAGPWRSPRVTKVRNWMLRTASNRATEQSQQEVAIPE
jgi:hypothetical protein